MLPSLPLLSSIRMSYTVDLFVLAMTAWHDESMCVLCVQVRANVCWCLVQCVLDALVTCICRYSRVCVCVSVFLCACMLCMHVCVCVYNCLCAYKARVCACIYEWIFKQTSTGADYDESKNQSIPTRAVMQNVESLWTTTGHVACALAYWGSTDGKIN